MGYGLKVVAADGSTVIIDGESNMFKIAATGTLVAPASNAPGDSQGTLDLALSYPTSPMNLWFIDTGGAFAGALLLPWTFFRSADGVAMDGFQGRAQANTPDSAHTRLRAITSTIRTDGYPAQTYKYYILSEAAI